MSYWLPWIRQHMDSGSCEIGHWHLSHLILISSLLWWIQLAWSSRAINWGALFRPNLLSFCFAPTQWMTVFAQFGKNGFLSKAIHQEKQTMMMKVLYETKSKHDGFTIFYNSCPFHSHLICHWWIYFACWLFQFQLKNKVSVRVNDNGDCGNFAKKELTNTNGLVFKLFLKKQWQIHEFPWIATFFILRGLVVFFSVSVW